MIRTEQMQIEKNRKPLLVVKLLGTPLSPPASIKLWIMYKKAAIIVIPWYDSVESLALVEITLIFFGNYCEHRCIHFQ